MLRSYYGQQRSIDAATAGEERCAQRAEQGETRRRARLEQDRLAERQARPSPLPCFCWPALSGFE